ncbi:MAG: hypothetical protein Q9160_002877 [Pyrenula sp. 1 TL-2023]
MYLLTLSLFTLSISFPSQILARSVLIHAGPETPSGYADTNSSPNPLYRLSRRADDPPSPNFGYCPAAGWPPADQRSGTGSPITSATLDSELQAALSEFSVPNIEAYIAKLVSFGTRHTLSNQTDPNRGIGAARDWVAATMRGFAAQSGGRMTVTLPSYTQQPDGSRIPFPVKITDIVATLQGSVTPSRYYVVSGHYDSRVTDVNNYVADAPGADDDASGVAISLEMARIMATRRPRSTMVFSVVAGEEQSLYGSGYQAQQYRAQGINVAGMLDNDIVGASVGDDGTSDPFTVRLFAQGPPPAQFDGGATRAAQRLTIGGENDSPARELARYVVEVAQNAYTGMKRIAVVYRLDRYLRGGDHASYINNGFLSAVRFTEPRENFAHQHQDVRVQGGTQYGDLQEFVDEEYVARVGRVNLATLYSLSQAPSTPANVTVNTTALTNESTLYWTPVNEPGVAGYEVVWRATDAPFWTNAISVAGGAGTRTVTVNISKDNAVLGVRAVGSNGYRSPAAFGGFPA